MASPSVVNKGFAGDLTRAEMVKGNREAFTPMIHGRMMREPIGFVYIHSVARRSFPINHPLIKQTLAGCTNGERFVTCMRIPDPFLQPCPDLERSGTRIDEHVAWLVALDALCPGNFSNDPYIEAKNPDFYAKRGGTNMICEGIWPSFHEVPPEDEIKRAEETRDKRYRWLTREATRLAATSTAQLNEFLQENPDTHIAMDALRMTAQWHGSSEVKATCQNCGDEIKQGIAFHQSSAGVLCVVDVHKAWKSGAVTRERYEELCEAQGVEPQKRPVGRPRG